LQDAIEALDKLKVHFDSEQMQEAEKALRGSEHHIRSDLQHAADIRSEIEKSVIAVEEALLSLEVLVPLHQENSVWKTGELKSSSPDPKNFNGSTINKLFTLQCVIQFAVIPLEIEIKQLKLSIDYIDIEDTSATRCKHLHDLSTTLAKIREALHAINDYVETSESDREKDIRDFSSSREYDAQGSGTLTKEHTRHYSADFSTFPFGLHCDLVSINHLIQKFASEINLINIHVPWTSAGKFTQTRALNNIGGDHLAASSGSEAAVNSTTMVKAMLVKCEENGTGTRTVFDKALLDARCTYFDDDRILESLIDLEYESKSLFEDYRAKGVELNRKLRDSERKQSDVADYSMVSGVLSYSFSHMSCRARGDEILTITKGYDPKMWDSLDENEKKSEHDSVAGHIGERFEKSGEFNIKEVERLRRAQRRHMGLKRHLTAVQVGYDFAHNVIGRERDHKSRPVNETLQHLQEAVQSYGDPSKGMSLSGKSNPKVMERIKSTELPFRRILCETDSVLARLYLWIIKAQEVRTTDALESARGVENAQIRYTFRRVCKLTAECHNLLDLGLHIDRAEVSVTNGVPWIANPAKFSALEAKMKECVRKLTAADSVEEKPADVHKVLRERQGSLEHILEFLKDMARIMHHSGSNGGETKVDPQHNPYEKKTSSEEVKKVEELLADVARVLKHKPSNPGGSKSGGSEPVAES